MGMADKGRRIPMMVNGFLFDDEKRTDHPTSDRFSESNIWGTMLGAKARPIWCLVLPTTMNVWRKGEPQDPRSMKLYI